MRILGLHKGHHSSICVLNDGEVELFIQEERFSHKKYDGSLNECLKLAKTYKVDYVATSDYNVNKSAMIHKKTETLYNIGSHHAIHALHSFYNSGFRFAVCVVADGWGTTFENGDTEVESVYFATYPKELTPIKKNFVDLGDLNPPYGLGLMYSYYSENLGFSTFEEGKAMGILPYHKNQDKLPIDITDEYKDKIKKMYNVQSYTQKKLLSLIKLGIEETGCKNVCISGGYGMNIISNYYIRKNLPKDVNIYCEPVANDAGQSMGLAKILHHYLTGDNTIRKQKSLYLGTECIY